MTKYEALARFLCGGTPEWQDMTQPYEELSPGLRARREQPDCGPAIYPEMPMWEWKHGAAARDILTFLGIDPDAAHE